MDYVFLWWLVLVIMSLSNILLLARLWYFSNSRYSLLPSVFVLVSAFRSILPRVDVERFVLFDSDLSSIFLGRSFATAAEICFAVQWLLLLNGKRKWLLLIPILLAEVFSWYAALTHNFVGSVVEESLWCFAAIMISLYFLYQRNFGFLTMTLAYALFLLTVDIPMYVSRIGSLRRFNLLAGLYDCCFHRIVTWDLHDWRSEMPWMFCYFVGGSLVSMYLARLINPQPNLSNGNSNV